MTSTSAWAGHAAVGLRQRHDPPAASARDGRAVATAARAAGLAPVVAFRRPLFVKQYGATLDNARAAEATIRRLFDEVSALLAGRRYLVVDRFSAADLTFAALGGPMVMPREHPSLSSDVELPAHLGTVVELLQATPAGQHAARMAASIAGCVTRSPAAAGVEAARPARDDGLRRLEFGGSTPPAPLTIPPS